MITQVRNAYNITKFEIPLICIISLLLVLSAVLVQGIREVDIAKHATEHRIKADIIEYKDELNECKMILSELERNLCK